MKNKRALDYAASLMINISYSISCSEYSASLIATEYMNPMLPGRLKKYNKLTINILGKILCSRRENEVSPPINPGKAQCLQ
jgi:hypothetical protein